MFQILMLNKFSCGFDFSEATGLVFHLHPQQILQLSLFYEKTNQADPEAFG